MIWKDCFCIESYGKDKAIKGEKVEGRGKLPMGIREGEEGMDFLFNELGMKETARSRVL